MSFIIPKFPKFVSNISLSLKPRFILFTLLSLLVSFKIFILTHNISIPQAVKTIHLAPLSVKAQVPKWVEVITGFELAHKGALRVGMLNFDTNQQSCLSLLGGIVDPVTIDLELLPSNVTWNKLFSDGACLEIPMPKAMKYPKLDIVMAQLPCGELIEGSNKSDITGIRDVHRLQVSMATAHLIVENAITKNNSHVYGVFVSKCEPMVEMFKCDDLVWNEGEYWIYKPDVEKLREVLSMPIGRCDFARPYGGALGIAQLEAKSILEHQPKPMIRPRHAYVTILHSSESYVCGAIALAQSILLTNTTKDLILLVDSTISNHSITGLQAAGWEIKQVERIRSPHAKLTDYNAWNYSKLRMWQLTNYSKVMFIDSDFIVLRNIDHFFNYPQLSVSPNDGSKFNSGLMIIEPSECFFRTLMSKRFVIKSYNGGDQGYLNEVFTYWHRLPEELNYMKFFYENIEVEKRVTPKDLYAIHYLGKKPWVCYRDYDCNWDEKMMHIFASDELNGLWWKVYDSMPKELQMYCRMTKYRDAMQRQWRASSRAANQSDEHWKIELKDPRQFNLRD